MASPRGARDVKTLASGDVITDDATSERYRVLSLIGQGGMGRVFKAQNIRTGAIHAVKCNQPIDPNNRTLVERVRREGEFLKGLRPHPHIVPVLGTGMNEDGVCWMLMPFLDGASVGELLAVLQRVPLVWALEIARAVCSALSAVHQAAIHRDIKPDNVFVTRDGGIFVLDWGAGKFYSVGRLTTTGTTLGTIAFSSPEQLRDPDGLDGRSDLFSVGILLFMMLAGAHPFSRDGVRDEDRITLGYRIIHEEPRSLAALAPELPPYVAKITHKLLSKVRDDRNRSAEEAVRVFVAAQNELRSRLGEPLPVARIFDAYDATLQAREAARLGTQDTEKTAASPNASGPRPKFGTVPLAAFVASPPPLISAVPPLIVPAPAESTVPASGGTVPIVAAAMDAEQDARIARKLRAIEVLSGDDTPETREALLAALRGVDESPIVRASAAIALGNVGDEACLEALQDAAATDPDPIVRRATEAAALELSLNLGLNVERVPFSPVEESAPPSARPRAVPAPEMFTETAGARPLAANDPPNAARSPWGSGLVALQTLAVERRPRSWRWLILIGVVAAAVVWALVRLVVR